MLAATVGEQDEGDIVVVQELEDLGSAGDRLGDMKQDAVDAARVLAIHSFDLSKPTIELMNEITYSKANAKEGGSRPDLPTLTSYLKPLAHATSRRLRPNSAGARTRLAPATKLDENLNPTVRQGEGMAPTRNGSEVASPRTEVLGDG